MKSGRSTQEANTSGYFWGTDSGDNGSKTVRHLLLSFSYCLISEPYEGLSMEKMKNVAI
jgi:hypothetical protein